MELNKFSVYILGLIWADGHVTYSNNMAKTPIVKHSCKEEDHANLFSVFKEQSGKWKYFITNNVGSYSKQKRKICITWQSNRELGEFLIDNDYKNKDVGATKILNIIPTHLHKYWFRGYFDGDGSISIKLKGHKSIAFTSSKNQNWFFLEKMLLDLDIKYKHRIISSRGGFSSQIRFSKKNDIIKFCRYIYSDYDNIGLYRKYEKFISLINNSDF